MTQYYQRQMPQAQGFFDPMMPGGLNLAGGVQDIVGRIIEKQRYEDAQRVQEEKLKQAQEGIDIDRLRAEAYKKYVEAQGEPSTPDWVQKGMMLYQMFPDKYETPGHAIKDVLKIKDPETIPTTVDPNLESNWLVPKFGEDWRNQLTTQRFWDTEKEYNLRTRPLKASILTEADYRKEMMKAKTDFVELMSRGRMRIIEAKAGDFMVQSGLGDAGAKYDEAARKFEEEGAKLWEEISTAINEAFLGATPGKTPGSSGTALGGGEPKPPAGWVKTGTTPDGRTIYLTPDGKRKVWGKE